MFFWLYPLPYCYSALDTRTIRSPLEWRYGRARGPTYTQRPIVWPLFASSPLPSPGPRPKPRVASLFECRWSRGSRHVSRAVDRKIPVPISARSLSRLRRQRDERPWARRVSFGIIAREDRAFHCWTRFSYSTVVFVWNHDYFLMVRAGQLPMGYMNDQSRAEGQSEVGEPNFVGAVRVLYSWQVEPRTRVSPTATISPKSLGNHS